MNSESEYYEFDGHWNSQSKVNLELDRIKQTSKIIPLDVESVADVGCGNGIFINYLKSKFKLKKVIAIDNSNAALKYVKTNKLKADISNLPINNNQYDLSVALEVIEHLDNNTYKIALKELSRISKKYIIISVPNEENLTNNFITCPQCKTTFSKSYHKRSYTIKKVKQLFNKYDFRCIKIKRICPRKNYWILTKLFVLYVKYVVKNKFNYPLICPICKYKNKNKNLNIISRSSPIKKIVKIVWPFNYKDRWIVALYKKGSV